MNKYQRERAKTKKKLNKLGISNNIQKAILSYNDPEIDKHVEQAIKICKVFEETYNKLMESLRPMFKQIAETIIEINQKFIIKNKDKKIILIPRPQKYLFNYKRIYIKHQRRDKLYPKGSRTRAYEKINIKNSNCKNCSLKNKR